MIHQSNFPPSIGQALAALAEFLTVHSISWESAMQSRDQIASPSPERQALFSLAFSFIAFAQWLPDALLVFKNNEQKEIVYANPALVQLFGCASLDEWLAYVNRSFSEIAAFEDRARIRNEAIRPSASSTPLSYRIRPVSQNVRWVEERRSDLFEPGRDALVCVTLADITERVEREQKQIRQIERLEARLRRVHQAQTMHAEVIETLSERYDSILYADLERQTIYGFRVSDRMGALLPKGASAKYDALFRDYASEWILPQDQAAFLAQTAPESIRAALTGKPELALTYQVAIHEPPLAMRLRVVNSVPGAKTVERVVIHLHPVENERRQNDILVDALETARRANRVKEAFLSNASRHLNGVLDSGQPASSPDPLSKASIRLLVVEDNEINREIETEILQDMGFQVEEAENGLQALGRLVADPNGFDLVVTDIQMPHMNGWQLAKAMRDNPAMRHIPLIALSANSLEADKQASRQAGIDIHLDKPIDPDILKQAIHHCLVS
ncbi:response regulator [uncultured Dubosiella sp.]|uniref:ATP-binding response regulator n=1 Tax=uncultured Dubosiella sp. TaxID=1937011 RepID=UPI0025B364A6|nr:response regulator [uncultured Dubosiella sp.]